MDDLTNWPKKSGDYKVVQMEIDGKPCLRFPDHRLNHSYIIKEIADKLERKFPIIADTNDHNVPALESEWYKVPGAGKARIDIENKVASLYGESEGYGIGINLDHLSHLRPLHPDWKIVAEI
jgi:hypothetical protein